MNADLIWEEPPVRTNHFHIAATLRQNPGRWARIDKSYRNAGARNIVCRANNGELSAYAPAGDYEATSRCVEGQYWVYIRYLGGGGFDE